MCLFNFDEHDVTVPMTVLEELDEIKSARKSGHVNIAREARIAIQNMNKVINGASGDQLSEGLKISASGGLFRVLMPSKKNDSALSQDLADNRIIESALVAQADLEGQDVSLVLVTNDLNMRIKAKASGVRFVEEYTTDNYINDIDHLASGYFYFKGCLVTSLEEGDSVRPEHWNNDRSKDRCFPVKLKRLKELCGEIYLNLYIYDEYAVFKVVEKDEDQACLKKMGFEELNKKSAFGISPRSTQQGMALDALLDPSISMVILTGPAGSGKTLLALAAAVEQTSQKYSESGSRLYDRIILTRSTPALAEEIGFLPGDESQKMAPWLMAFDDNMEVLLDIEKGSDQIESEETAGMLMKDCGVQLKNINYLRGRSFNNKLIILDEAQSTTPHQMKSIITRIGQGSKLVVLGNLGQIDSHVTPNSSGLTSAVEVFKNFEGSTSIILQGTERSALASYAEENM